MRSWVVRIVEGLVSGRVSSHLYKPALQPTSSTQQESKAARVQAQKFSTETPSLRASLKFLQLQLKILCKPHEGMVLEQIAFEFSQHLIQEPDPLRTAFCQLLQIQVGRVAQGTI